MTKATLEQRVEELEATVSELTIWLVRLGLPTSEATKIKQRLNATKVNR